MNARHLLARSMAMLVVIGSLLGATASGAGGATIRQAPAGGGAQAAQTASLADFGEPFHWLPPLGVESGDPAKFDSSLLNGLIVDICRIEGSSCTPVKTITSTSALSERLRIGRARGRSPWRPSWTTATMASTPAR